MGRLEKALTSLRGLWVGDAFGGNFEFESVDWERPKRAAKDRKLPNGIWRYTDDTQMALSIYETLRINHEIDTNILAASFTKNFDISRGYGLGTEELLQAIAAGGDWQELSSNLFDGMGSFGNGAAMRVAPVGAYFAEDMQAVVENARKSSIITHTHPDAVAGAIAVAIAAAQATLFKLTSSKPDAVLFWKTLLSNLPETELRKQVQKASLLDRSKSTKDIAKILGSGWDVSAIDSVPFALWIAIKYMDNFEEALWQTISVGGDTDTTGAIVGGIVASYTGTEGIPSEWEKSCEPLPTWALGSK